MCCFRGRFPLAGLMAALFVLSPHEAGARGWGHSPRGGFNPLGAAVAAREAWLAKERRAEAIRKLKNAENQYAGAVKAEKEGDIRLATTLYLRLVTERPKNRHRGQAQQALKKLADNGRAAMKKADQLIESGDVEVGFKQLDKLALDYQDVPRFNHEIAQHVQKLHNEPKYKGVLNEKRAGELVDEAKRAEAANEICCAYLAYEEAAKLLPAPSAKLAEERYTEMKKDPQIVADAEACVKARECLHEFHIAELLEKSQPGKAEAMFKKILARSPASSEVHRCAIEELAKLHGEGNG